MRRGLFPHSLVFRVTSLLACGDSTTWAEGRALEAREPAARAHLVRAGPGLCSAWELADQVALAEVRAGVNSPTPAS